jgi:hypothetical protein
MTRQATEAMLEQAGKSGQAAMEFTNRVVSTVTGQGGSSRDDEEDDEESRSKGQTGRRQD